MERYKQIEFTKDFATMKKGDKARYDDHLVTSLIQRKVAKLVVEKKTK